MKNKEIGGYFQLELALKNDVHTNSIHLNTARSCFEYVLISKKYTKVYIPYYICNVIIDIIKKLKIDYECYSINDKFEIEGLICLKNTEALLYVNYWGLKSSYVEKLAKIYGNSLIVDNSQAFFARPMETIDTFYSARKFFGVSDGAYLYMENRALPSIELLEQDYSAERMLSLLTRIERGANAGYLDFISKEQSFANEGVKQMSSLTSFIMKSIDMNKVSIKRRENFNTLHKYLSSTNTLPLNLDKTDIPMVYPYLPQRQINRSELIAHGIFVAKYWENVADMVSPDSLEYKLTNSLIPLPIDQRYSIEDMMYIVDCIYASDNAK